MDYNHLYSETYVLRDADVVSPDQLLHVLRYVTPVVHKHL